MGKTALFSELTPVRIMGRRNSHAAAPYGTAKARAAAILAGSVSGWACPSTDPADYDAQGKSGIDTWASAI